MPLLSKMHPWLKGWRVGVETLSCSGCVSKLCVAGLTPPSGCWLDRLLLIRRSIGVSLQPFLLRSQHVSLSLRVYAAVGVDCHYFFPPFFSPVLHLVKDVSVTDFSLFRWFTIFLVGVLSTILAWACREANAALIQLYSVNNLIICKNMPFSLSNPTCRITVLTSLRVGEDVPLCCVSVPLDKQWHKEEIATNSRPNVEVIFNTGAFWCQFLSCCRRTKIILLL